MEFIKRGVELFCLLSLLAGCQKDISQYNPLKSTELATSANTKKEEGTFHPIFQDVVLELATKTDVPVRLPAYVPHYPGGPRLNPIVVDINEAKYEILLAYTPDCGGENFCRLGKLQAEIVEDSFSLEGEETILLNDGSTAYFTDAECNAYCTDSVLAWKKNSVVYEIGIKAGKLPILVKMANSL